MLDNQGKCVILLKQHYNMNNCNIFCTHFHCILYWSALTKTFRLLPDIFNILVGELSIQDRSTIRSMCICFTVKKSSCNVILQWPILLHAKLSVDRIVSWLVLVFILTWFDTYHSEMIQLKIFATGRLSSNNYLTWLFFKFPMINLTRAHLLKYLTHLLIMIEFVFIKLFVVYLH